jgi:hypothetical protein
MFYENVKHTSGSLLILSALFEDNEAFLRSGAVFFNSGGKNSLNCDRL